LKMFLFFRKLLLRICAIGVFDKDKPSFETLKSKSGVFFKLCIWEITAYFLSTALPFSTSIYNISKHLLLW